MIIIQSNKDAAAICQNFAKMKISSILGERKNYKCIGEGYKVSFYISGFDFSASILAYLPPMANGCQILLS
jgi:hypothetical protein